MSPDERIIRILCVSKALAAFGDVSDETAEAIVDLTSGIPWYVPPSRGEAQTTALLFAAAVTKASLSVTFGKPKPGDILSAAIEIAGKVRSDQGHETERLWVKAARLPVQALPLPLAELKALPMPKGLSGSVRAIGGGK